MPEAGTRAPAADGRPMVWADLRVTVPVPAIPEEGELERIAAYVADAGNALCYGVQPSGPPWATLYDRMQAEARARADALSRRLHQPLWRLVASEVVSRARLRKARLRSSGRWRPLPWRLRRRLGDVDVTVVRAVPWEDDD